MLVTESREPAVFMNRMFYVGSNNGHGDEGRKYRVTNISLHRNYSVVTWINQVTKQGIYGCRITVPDPDHNINLGLGM